MGVVEVHETRTLWAPIAQVWAVVSDTDALNRAAGFGEVSFAPHASATAARLVGTTRQAGVLVRYDELPFVWREH
jgi:hypothetical protein